MLALVLDRSVAAAVARVGHELSELKRSLAAWGLRSTTSRLRAVAWVGDVGYYYYSDGPAPKTEDKKQVSNAHV
jgi:hypothetical protein